MNFHSLLSFVPFLIMACLVLLGIFTRRGRNVGISFLYGGRVVEDLGEVARYAVSMGQQSVCLLKCVKGNAEFYVLESRSLAPLSIRYNWVRIDAASLKRINQQVADKGRTHSQTSTKVMRDDQTDWSNLS